MMNKQNWWTRLCFCFWKTNHMTPFVIRRIGWEFISSTKTSSAENDDDTSGTTSSVVTSEIGLKFISWPFLHAWVVVIDAPANRKSVTDDILKRVQKTTWGLKGETWSACHTFHHPKKKIHGVKFLWKLVNEALHLHPTLFGLESIRRGLLAAYCDLENVLTHLHALLIQCYVVGNCTRNMSQLLESWIAF